MLGDQASTLMQGLVADGLTQAAANRIARAIGQCKASLTHRGAITNYGRTNLEGPTKIRGPLDIGSRDSRFDDYLNVSLPTTFSNDVSFGSDVTIPSGGTLTLPFGYGATGFLTGTIGTALGRDGTATLTIEGGGGATKVVYGYFIPSDKQAKSGSRIGAFYDELNDRWPAVVTDECLENA